MILFPAQSKNNKLSDFNLKILTLNAGYKGQGQIEDCVCKWFFELIGTK